MEKSLRQQIQHLCGYISDRGMVAAYINQEHGLKLTTVDIISATQDDKRRFYSLDREPMTPSPLIVTHKHKGYDDLALALFKYHAARTHGPAQVFWLSRALDWKPKPKTTVDL